MEQVILEIKRIVDYPSIDAAKKAVEYMSKYPGVIGVSMTPFERKDMSYNDYLKENFNAKQQNKKSN